MSNTEKTTLPGKTTPPGSKPRVINSSELFDRAPTVTILHQGAQYTLRLTASNKLILTK